jgi:hypothetical protein
LSIVFIAKKVFFLQSGSAAELDAVLFWGHSDQGFETAAEMELVNIA